MTKLCELHNGDLVHVDDGFTCMTEGLKAVHEDEDGLYVYCRSGKHYLDGQEDAPGTNLIGIERIWK